jgi:hypothetical protein
MEKSVDTTTVAAYIGSIGDIPERQFLRWSTIWV